MRDYICYDFIMEDDQMMPMHVSYGFRASPTVESVVRPSFEAGFAIAKTGLPATKMPSSFLEPRGGYPEPDGHNLALHPIKECPRYSANTT